MFQPVRDWWKLTKRYKRSVMFGAGILLILAVLMFAVGVGTWEYTNSVQFCGTTCHTMPPEYTAYQQSPHARVLCVDCHLGRESAFNAIPRKAREITHVTKFLTSDFHTPIYVRNLRPARETCEECHLPEKFSADSFKEITRYSLNENNTPTETFLVLNTGGQVRPGVSRGIHWHTTNQVWFLATDDLKQDIPYVREVLNDGTVREYYDVTSDVDPDYVAAHEDELHLMDCIDCHNRASHKFPSPEEAMDEAISQGSIDADIPFIKSWGADLLSRQFSSHEEANQQIADLRGWYQENYPAFYAQNELSVDTAVEQIQNLYTETVFPQMDIGWATHPDNLGHKNFPGCFRCHGGNHLTADGQAIRLECNICHTIPEVSGPGLPAPVINVARADEPESHHDTNWLALHREERFAADAECAGCHNTADAGLATNVSFCSNSACHGTAWVYAGLNAPALRERLALEPAPTPEPQAQAVPDTQAPVSSAALEKSRGPDIPHPLSEQRQECQRCHTVDGLVPTPQNHADYTEDECTQCHRPGVATLTEGEQ